MYHEEVLLESCLTRGSVLGDKANDIISPSFHSCELPIDASVRPVPYYQYNIMMITDGLISSFPYKDVVEIAHLDDIRNNNNIPIKNNDFLIEIDPDHNSAPNGIENQCKHYDTSLEFNKTLYIKEIYQFCLLTFVVQNTS